MNITIDSKTDCVTFEVKKTEHPKAHMSNYLVTAKIGDEELGKFNVKNHLIQDGEFVLTKMVMDAFKKLRPFLQK